MNLVYGICSICGNRMEVNAISCIHCNEGVNKMDKLKENIVEWSKNRGLNSAEPSKQFIKLMEEIGELAQGMAKANKLQIIDSIGDVFVVLVILAEQHGLDIEHCVEYAWEEIKDRKGKMVDGVFVKEEDLK